jgi:translation initiation factor IF-3
MGVVSTVEALRIARERGLDLVEVAPTAVPPVCRLLEYGKFKYEQTKKEREARKRQKVITLKEMRLRPKIDDHDLEVKTRMIEEFLRAGDKVKVTVIFRGREITHADIGRSILQKVAATLKEAALVERAPLMEGKNLSLILSPVGVKPAAAPGTSRSEGPAQAPSLRPAAGSAPA